MRNAAIEMPSAASSHSPISRADEDQKSEEGRPRRYSARAPRAMARGAARKIGARPKGRRRRSA